MTDFLLELRSEEIPARMQAKARDDLARLFAAELAKAGIVAGELVTYATPRRLALIARDLPDATDPVREETKGPRASAPPQALEGFLRKTGLMREQLVERDGVLFAVVERAGRATADVLGEAIPAIVRAFPWPKSMRWGAASASTESLRWVRPLQGIVALFGSDIVPVEIAGIVAGATTVGHRFHHPGAITLGGAHDYVAKLRACHVVVDPAERAVTIATAASMLVAKAGLTLVRDEGLLAENAGLTEWPMPLLGRFDAGFLDVPPEVIQLTARVNQKYFVCRDAGGELANAFICTANIDATDGGEAIVEGNRKVLAARLSDARFFYEQDLKVPLDEQATKLDRIVFHEKLGTVADKVERVAKLAEWLASEGIVPDCDPALARRAAELCKADLVTGMVGEFPELQGVMGGYYARAQGEDPRVADAIRDHYKPVGQGDEVPTAPVTVAVSLADKLDSLLSFFGTRQIPSGSKDPFALRRTAISLIGLIVSSKIRLNFSDLYDEYANILLDRAKQKSVYLYGVSHTQRDENGEGWSRIDSLTSIDEWRERTDPFEQVIISSENYGVPSGLNLSLNDYPTTILGVVPDLNLLHDIVGPFFADRLKVQQREAGVRHDLIDAVFALGGEDDLVRLLARVHALQAFVGTEDGANLLAGYKRAANILKKEGWGPPPADPVTSARTGVALRVDAPNGAAPAFAGMMNEATATAATGQADLAPAEAALTAALAIAAPAASAAVAREDFAAAMAALASLRAPIDRFFEEVIVNDADPAVRARRLALLAAVREAVHGVADFSRIDG